MDGEKVILTNAELSLAGLFTVNAGTTLVLDENITVDGQHKELNSPGGNGKYLFHVKGGTLEMQKDSRITRAQYNYGNSGYSANMGSEVSSSSVLVEENGAFNMYGGTIDQSRGRFCAVNIYTGSFEMWEGAVITNNSLLYYERENIATVAEWIKLLSGQVAAVKVAKTSTFTMHGGEISNTNYRGVFLADTATFVMKGGRIINNGNSGYSYDDILHYPRGGGVCNTINATFHMEGGEISGNGNAGMPGPGSGIYSTSKATTTDNFLLNGPVTIQNNTIMVNHNLEYGIKIGSGFSTEGVIEIDLCYMGSALTSANYITKWPPTKFLLYALDEGAETIAIASVKEQFVPVKCFSMATGLSVQDYPTLSATMNSDGSVTIVDNGNGN
jgi:hypothetical protein